MTIPAAFLIAFLTGHGYGPAQRDAVLWNATRESGLNSGAVSKGGRHVGLWQWNGPRKAALLRFAASRGKPWTDAVTQITFMDGELRSMAFARRFFAATSATAARALFCLEYERARVC